MGKIIEVDYDLLNNFDLFDGFFAGEARVVVVLGGFFDSRFFVFFLGDDHFISKVFALEVQIVNSHETTAYFGGFFSLVGSFLTFLALESSSLIFNLFKLLILHRNSVVDGNLLCLHVLLELV